MARKRIATGLSGILAIDKPLGVTSHDVVNTVRTVTGERRVGHAGTLDPLATGLLLVCVGPATRLADYLMAGIKTYQTRICFGAATNTDDAQGEVIRRCEIPEQLADELFAQQILKESIGELKQVPPAFSAIKKDGVKAYKAARAGDALELEARTVQLYEAKLMAAQREHWDIEITVSKGFYVRAFARDVGEMLGTAAHVGSLRRTASGAVSIEQAIELESLKAADSEADPLKTGSSQATGVLPFINPVVALGLPVLEIDAAQARRVAHGNTLTVGAAQLVKQPLTCIVSDNKLLALYEGIKPKVVIPDGIRVS